MTHVPGSKKWVRGAGNPFEKNLVINYFWCTSKNMQMYLHAWTFFKVSVQSVVDFLLWNQIAMMLESVQKRLIKIILTKFRYHLTYHIWSERKHPQHTFFWDKELSSCQRCWKGSKQRVSNESRRWGSCEFKIVHTFLVAMFMHEDTSACHKLQNRLRKRP